MYQYLQRALPLATIPVVVIGCLLFVIAEPSRAENAGSIVGQVVSEDGSAVGEAVVHLIDLRREVAVTADGSFEFEAVPAGSHLLHVHSNHYGSHSRTVEVAAGEVTTLEIEMGKHRHTEEIVVTAGGESRSRLDLSQPVSVLSGESLAIRVQPTLGETLRQEPGVNSTSYAPGASRPVIRGIGGDRVRMLQSGLGTGDVSSTSPDHAVSLDPGGAERIEVLRGPSTLLYGSSAIGGVVNVIDSSIPSFQTSKPVTGSVEIAGGSVADERYGRVDLDGAAGKWAWHLDGHLRNTDDYSIPGSALATPLEDQDDHAEESEQLEGTLLNSDVETRGASFGLSFFGNSGFLGVAVSGFDTDFGIPPGGHVHGDDDHGEEDGDHEEEDGDHEEVDGELIRNETERRRVDFSGEITTPFSIFRGFKARLGYIDYEHSEIEGDIVGTTFFRDTWEGRFEFVQKEMGRWSGSFGLQVLDTDLEAVGEEAFIPPSDTRSVGLFAFEEMAAGENLSLQLGGRVESVDNSTRETDLPERSFSPVSLSLGLVWELSGGWSVAGSLARSQKAPNSEELYSNGPHAATQAFEIGDPDLDIETSIGGDIAVRLQRDRIRGEISLFFNRFDDFIFQDFTGEEEDGLPVLLYSQGDADFVGGELDLEIGLWDSADQHLDLRLSGDIVRAEQRSDDDPLPRIPPFRLGAALHYGSNRWHAMGEVRWVDDQTRVAENETPTPGYTMLNLSLGYRFFLGEQLVDLLLRGTNLTDEEARNHVSITKDFVPLPGRDIALLVKFSF